MTYAVALLRSELERTERRLAAEREEFERATSEWNDMRISLEGIIRDLQGTLLTLVVEP
jgi:hypothetical protein